MSRLDQGYDATALVDRLLRERDHARALACHYEAIIAEYQRIEPLRFTKSDAYLPRCHACGGVTEHVLGCPEMDRPR